MDIKQSDFFFHYSDRYRSGSFDIRTVSRWQTEGQSYYEKYILHLTDGGKVWLNPNEFYDFQKKFNQL